jgi:transposase
MRLPKFLLKLIPGFEIKDMKEWLNKGHIDIFLEHRYQNHESSCHRCQSKLSRITGTYRQRVQTMPILNYKSFLYIKRRKGHCPSCKKIRAEYLEFISPETPHLTKEYSWWLGRMCEISAVSRVGELVGIDKTTMHRLDFARLKRMFQNYKIPKVTRISVDEVYARKKKYGAKESRDNRFFTVICDLDTRRVIWVSESREAKALDEFFHIIGPQRCKEIKVVAMDQHDSYKYSVEKNCPMATVVWDRFHIMQNFNQAVDSDRMWLHKHLMTGENKRLTRGKFKRLFVKKSDRRTKVETRHINDVLKDNQEFAYLELIKEGMHQIYDSADEWEAKEKLLQIGDWIEQCPHFYELKKWYKNFNRGWETFKNYFHYPVSSSLSEGQNNVIKTLKKRAYGYRNMAYFKLKILQVCGFLNSRYVPMSF